MAATLGAMMAGTTGDRNDTISRYDPSRVESRRRNPWDSVQLSKAERRGKTPEELQALRKAKWEAAQNE